MDIYPAIDLKDGKCVRLVQGRFDAVTTYGDDPVAVAVRWKEQGAKWLHLVDLDGARSGTPDPRNRQAVRDIISATGLPVQFGGGIRSESSVAEMLEIGVTRVVIGTAAAKDSLLAELLFTKHGAKIAVGVDARDGMVAIHGWQEQSGESTDSFVRRMAELGASRIIYTDISRDGMLQGVNIASLVQVAAAVPNIAVTASGGVSTIADIVSLLEIEASSAPNVDGVIIGKALYTGGVDLQEVMRLTVNSSASSQVSEKRGC